MTLHSPFYIWFNMQLSKSIYYSDTSLSFITKYSIQIHCRVLRQAPSNNKCFLRNFVLSLTIRGIGFIINLSVYKNPERHILKIVAPDGLPSKNILCCVVNLQSDFQDGKRYFANSKVDIQTLIKMVVRVIAICLFTSHCTLVMVARSWTE